MVCISFVCVTTLVVFTSLAVCCFNNGVCYRCGPALPLPPGMNESCMLGIASKTVNLPPKVCVTFEPHFTLAQRAISAGPARPMLAMR